MTSVISLSTDDLNQALINELRERFGSARLDIVVSEEAESGRMTPRLFWDYIDRLDWTASNDTTIVAPLIDLLQQQEPADIYSFEAYLSKCLYQLDTEAHAAVFGPDYLSPDDFLYARAAVVANGKAIFETVLEYPGKMPTEVSFEPLLYVARTAYEKKTGKEMDYFPLYSYETYSNKAGWPSRNVA